MDCCLSFQNEKSKIEVIDKIPDGKDFDYLRPAGRIYYNIDEVYDVLKIKIAFDSSYMNSVRVCSKNKKVRQHCLLLQKTPSFLPELSYESSCYDTFFWFRLQKNNGSDKIFLCVFKSCVINTKYTLLHGLFIKRNQHLV